MLARERALHRGDRITQRRGNLEVFDRGARFHARAQSLDELGALAAEEHLHVLDLLGVGSRWHVDRARARAPLDLILQAHTAARLEHVIGAGAELEVAIERT